MAGRIPASANAAHAGTTQSRARANGYDCALIARNGFQRSTSRSLRSVSSIVNALRRRR
jgi:hypothetical protein